MNVTSGATLAALVAVTLLWFALPFVPAVQELRRRSGIAPLHVPANDERDVRFFAQRFRELVATALGDAPAPGLVRLPSGSTARVVEGPGVTELTGSSGSSLLFARSSARVAAGAELLVETYARAALEVGPGATLRAALGEADVLLGPGVRVLRWVHAGGELRAGAACVLHGRATADRLVHLGEGCRFESLMAPRIEYGAPIPPPAPPPRPTVVDPSRLGTFSAGRCRVLGDLELPPSALLTCDLVVTGALRLGAGAVVGGSVKAHGAVVLEDGSLVEGSLFARGDVAVGRGCRVAGPVVAERRVRVGAGSRIGHPAAPTTLSGREVEIEAGAVSHGAVHAEVGSIRPADAPADPDGRSDAGSP